MEIRHPIHPEHLKMMDTKMMRRNFLIENLFEKDKIHMTYSHIDRIIVGGVNPVHDKLELQVSKELGVDYFLERREIGIFNIAAKGAVTVDGKEYILENKDALYVGMGAKEVGFKSADKNKPAKFYFNSTPAHTAYPNVKVSLPNAKCLKLGEDKNANKRIIYQCIHPAVLKSCQLVMGLTMLEPHHIWNSMPCHTHARRMEVYFYFDLPLDSLLFHFFGEPDETRHLVMRNEEAVISPSWSIHSGVGTHHYTFIWGMAGENQTFTDMDDVSMSTLK